MEVKNVSKITKEDGNTEIAPQPAKILNTKPIAIHTTSIIGKDFSFNEYQIFNNKYDNTDKNTKLFINNAKAKLPKVSSANIFHAKDTETSPEAMGRFFFVGWSLSSFTSEISLKMYTAEAIKQNAINAQNADIVEVISKNFNEKINGINTTTFFM